VRLVTGAVVLAVLLAGCVTGGPSPAVEGSPTPEVGGPTPNPATAPTRDATVTRVVDGDTVAVEYDNGTDATVRLVGVDAPETRGDNDPAEFRGVPTTEAGRRCLGDAGANASAALDRRLAGERVRLGFDPNEERRDRYGRVLAYVYHDGRQAGYWLVTRGHARAYESDFVERARYERREREAREARRGLWSCLAEASPAAGRVSVQVSPDAPGPDAENLAAETVTLRNEGDRPLDLSGWSVADATGKTYTFESGPELASGESVVLHTGRGTDGPSDRYWGRSAPVWNNDGDVVTVRDDAGRVVVTHRYGS
jgi:micrococcal nuclease